MLRLIWVDGPRRLLKRVKGSRRSSSLILLFERKSHSGGRRVGGGGFPAEDLALRVTNTRFPTSCRGGRSVERVFSRRQR